jgi:putative ABC transport system permease protein
MEVKRYSYGVEKSFFDLDKDGEWSISWMPTGLGPALIEEIPEIVQYTRWESGNGILIFNDKIFQEQVHYVDPGFFRMFDFRLIQGDPNSVLEDKNSMVITEKIHDKYFKEWDPIGRMVQLNLFGMEKTFIVKGIIENPPANSSLDFSILIHQENRPYYEENLTNWRSFNNPTFIQLATNTNHSQFSDKLRSFQDKLRSFQDKLRSFQDKYFAEEIKGAREKEMVGEEVPVFELGVKPLTDIHLDTGVPWHKSSDPVYSFILGGIGLLILVIACINYISLSLSNSSSRSKEVGIRKVMGASPSNLTWQFWSESQVLVMVALIAGIFLAILFLEPFNKFTQKSLSLFSTKSVSLFGFLFLINFIVGLLAGGYPAVYLSRFQPVKVLKSNTTSKYNTLMIRGLVIFQYSISGFLIISAMIMFHQMRYITTKDLGYNKDQVLVIPTFTGWSDEGEKVVNRLDQALIEVPRVLQVAGTSASFNKGWSRNGFEIDGREHSAFTYRIDHDYVKTLGLEIIEGRDFDPERPSDLKDAILVNESLVRDFGWENPVGKHLFWRSDTSSYVIIGVVKNYHYLSLENEIEPVILYFNPENGKITTAMVKIKPENIPGTIREIENRWKQIESFKPFEYSFLDDDVAQQYSSYQRWMNIMSASTGLAIFIACLGLFGLSGMNTANRMKEIGIRKVLGASIRRLFIMLNRQVLFLAVISFVIAIPLSWYIMGQWLETFKYKIEISWPIFITATLAGITIAMATVSYHIIKVAQINPADILKDE